MTLRPILILHLASSLFCLAPISIGSTPALADDHGASFQLSLLGFDSDFDYQALTMEGRGRRVFPGAPEQSLVLRKATALLAHGGGKRFEIDSLAYETIRQWIDEGMPRSRTGEPTLTHITVAPLQLGMRPGQQHSAAVTAHYSDGITRDVTQLTAFQSNEPAHASVDEAGQISAGSVAGEAVIMARYMNLIATCRVTVPLAGEVPDQLYADLPRQNLIDSFVWDKLKELRFTPSSPANDSKYMRRAYLDIIGRLPTPDETRAFLADKTPDKRSQLVDRLLQRPEYADFHFFYSGDVPLNAFWNRIMGTEPLILLGISLFLYL